MQALQAATRNPAIFLGQEKVRGTIERGKAADLVLLESDPLADLSQRPRIAGVFQDGKFYSREQLQGMVGAAMRAMNAVP
jgi:imidazolonepropionase-like amidohydrolase